MSDLREEVAILKDKLERIRKLNAFEEMTAEDGSRWFQNTIYPQKPEYAYLRYDEVHGIIKE